MLRLKELREKRGISMREVARNLGMPYTTYVNYEKGNCEPNSETLIALANYYETSIDYMIGKDEIQSFSTPGDFVREWGKTTGQPYVINSDGSVFHFPSGTSLDDLIFYCKTPEEQKFAVNLLSAAHPLNESGKREAVKRVSELAEIPKYQKPPEDTTPGDK